jgi:hypothetical protein
VQDYNHHFPLLSLLCLRYICTVCVYIVIFMKLH